jgi:competence protein ComEC
MDILRFPLAKITAFFLTGIVAGFYIRPTLEFVATLLLLFFCIFCTAFLLSRKIARLRIPFSLISYVLAVSIGLATITIHDYRLQKKNYIHYSDEKLPHVLHVTLRAKLKTTTFRQRYVAIVSRVDNQKASGRILLSFRRKSGLNLHIGNNLKVTGYIIRNKPPLNPDQFDYGKYLDNKSIPAQLFVDDAFFKMSRETKKDLWHYAEAFRDRVLSNLRKSGFHERELQVFNALLLGQQQEISADIVQDYQYAGAVHILSVSGLHVGFILLFLNFLLSPLPKTKSGRMIRLALTLVSLWAFAFIAGLSPSVVRSATMFSFVAYGLYLRRSTNIFHTLIVSILLILLFEPSFLFDVGFQLSYAALFFILWLQPFLSTIWKPRNVVLKYFWDILTVSFAAQIGAFPLSIYYFHQFPGLFFLTNLIIIPFLSVIMCIGVLDMLVASFFSVPEIAGKILERSIFVLNEIIRIIASFETFIIRDISFNFWMLITAYGFIVALVIWLKTPNYTRAVFALITLATLQSSILVTRITVDSNEEMIVFNLKKNTLIADRHGPSINYFCQSKAPALWILKSYSIANFGRLDNELPIPNILWFNGKKIMIVDSTAVYLKNKKPAVLLLIKSPKVNLERMLDDLDPEIVIADGSNFKSYVAKWKATCRKRKIPFHDTNERGYFRWQK